MGFWWVGGWAGGISDGGVVVGIAGADTGEGIPLAGGVAHPRECPWQGGPHHGRVVRNRRGK